jgi:Sulfotransferase family
LQSNWGFWGKDVILNQNSLSAFKFTFLHGVRVRSGTNYIAKIISCNSQIQLVPPNKTTDEFPLLRVMDSWEKAFSDFLSKYNGDKNAFQFSQFTRHLGFAWLSYLINNFSLQPGHIFLKDPSVRHIDRFSDIFPESKLIILVRDGRDNVASSMKAGLAVRAHHSFFERSKRRLKHIMLRDFITSARDWSECVGKILKFDEKFKNTPLASQYLILRYEDIYQNPRQMAQRIFTFMEVPFDEATLESIENAEVVGSSFYSPSRQEDAKKPNWIATPKTDAFNPMGRWKRWNALQKNLFKRIAGNELILMGYEKDLNWQ